MIKYMLDTNIVIDLINSRHLEILKKFNAKSGLMVISSITLAELMRSAENSQDVEKKTRAVLYVVSKLSILAYDEKAAHHYGSICADLEKNKIAGKTNDLHVAAHARSAGLILVTNDAFILGCIKGILVENWGD